MKFYQTTAASGLNMAWWIEDDNGKRTPMPIQITSLPKRRFPKPDQKPMTPWELHQAKQWLLKFLGQDPQ